LMVKSCRKSVWGRRGFLPRNAWISSSRDILAGNWDETHGLQRVSEPQI
jgi:hypothetical protein